MATQSAHRGHRLGWIGTGRMGYEIAARLLRAGCDLAVYNRTRAKAEPLIELGAVLVESPADLADRDIVFMMVAGPEDAKLVTIGTDGVLSRVGSAPAALVDSTTISVDASAQIREHAERIGVDLLAAPVSGNPSVIRAGRLGVIVSGSPQAAELAWPYLQLFGSGVTYMGPGDSARLAKLCHNLVLGVLTQALAEVTVLAEKGGISRQRLLDFLNASVLGSSFTRYKTPAFVALDFSPTFTVTGLLKDFDLGLTAAHELGVPAPVAELVNDQLKALAAAGFADADFAALLAVQAQRAGLELEPAEAPADGLDEESI